ncbi:hypothetical protein [Winogradskyella forsetii]|uniref:hypothetical protein n=1 Tax=Winogradskyella forsetii TaxID=2686077 RepID=UPI0015BCFBFA|nr:hypothetical protein [Winogradskyella forsetii]
MKKINLLFAALFVLTILCCNSDDNSNNNPLPVIENNFSIGENVYNTTNGYLVHQLSNNGTGYKNLVVLSNGTVLSDPFDGDTLNSNNYSDDTDTILVLTINSTSIELLESGTYNLDTTLYNGSGNLYRASVITGISIENSLIDDFTYESFSSINSSNPIISGSVTISNENDIYTFSYNLNQSEVSINGNFIGNLTELEYIE